MATSSPFMIRWAAVAAVLGSDADNNTIQNATNYHYIYDDRGNKDDNGNNDVVLNVVSQNQITAPMKPTKAGGYYNIVIPNTTTTPNVACVDTPLVETCRITTVPTTDGSSYTKIQVKVPAGVGVRTMNTTNINDYSFGNQEFTEEYEQELLNDLNADQSFEEEEFYEEESFEETAEEVEGSWQKFGKALYGAIQEEYLWHYECYVFFFFHQPP